jgi:hypothetical protein
MFILNEPLNLFFENLILGCLAGTRKGPFHSHFLFSFDTYLEPVKLKCMKPKRVFNQFWEIFLYF